MAHNMTQQADIALRLYNQGFSASATSGVVFPPFCAAAQASPALFRGEAMSAPLSNDALVPHRPSHSHDTDEPSS